MVEINNQRVPRYAGVVVRIDEIASSKTNHVSDVIVGVESYLPIT